MINYKEIIKVVLYVILGVAVTLLGVYMLTPPSTPTPDPVLTEKETVVYVNTCVDTSESSTSNSKDTNSDSNNKVYAYSRNETREPHRAYFEYSNGTIDRVGSSYTNEPRECAKLHDISKC